jgi:CDP-paratose 2-epimerase
MMPAAGDSVLVTGGAGFIGTNLADRLLSDGRRVTILDSLARRGVERNVQWLADRHGKRLRVANGDVRDAGLVADAMADAEDVYHLAAQVAVTTSLVNPLEDFEVNARGTLNVLEAARARRRPPRLLFTSTNKVYGALEDIELTRREQRLEPVDPAIRSRGIGEWRSLCFESPYGCSKGAADQYVLDYARCYGLPAAVFRMSCIYGPHQMGTEDQGWLAHFLIRARGGEELTIYGDGLQVRDALYVTDLVDALVLAMEHIDVAAGKAFNIGGGPENTTSLLELLAAMQERFALVPPVQWSAMRTGDQRYFVADTSRFEAMTRWQPKVLLEEGLTRLHEWVMSGHAGVTPRLKVMA